MRCLEAGMGWIGAWAAGWIWRYWLIMVRTGEGWGQGGGVSGGHPRIVRIKIYGISGLAGLSGL